MFQVHRTDTGQFVVIDPATGVVVIEDDLQVGYDRVVTLAAERPARSVAPTPERPGPDSAFEFRGRQGLLVLLTVGLPFVWMLFVYLALRDLDRPAGDVEAEIEALRAEVAELRNAGGGGGTKSKQGDKQKKAKAKPKAEPKPREVDRAPAPAPPATDPASTPATDPASVE